MVRRPGAGAATLAGCTSRSDDPGAGADTTPTHPPSCPTTQGLDVEWPTDLDAESAESFVDA